jgi:lipopolysaccharide transport system ATP-binding protein
VLAVGDVAFQQKCLGKLHEVSHEGRTILFVSHNLGVMMELCSRAILLHEGQIVTSGTTSEVVKTYVSKYSDQTHELVTTTFHEGAAITKVVLLDYQQQSVQVIDYKRPFYIDFQFDISEPLLALSQWVRLENQFGVSVLFAWLAYQQAYQPGVYRARCEIPGELLTPGRYYVDIGLTNHRVHAYSQAHKCLSFDIISEDVAFDPNDTDWGMVYPRLSWWIE